MQQASQAEGCAALGEAVVSSAAWQLIKDVCVGEICSSDGDVRLLEIHGDAGQIGSGEPDLTDVDGGGGEDADRLRKALFTQELLELQQAGQGDYNGPQRTAYESALEAYVHETARRSISVLDEVAERRRVVVAFAKVMGLEAAFEAKEEGLDAVQRCLITALDCIKKHQGLLRQFILDDKGVVVIWTFGLTQVRAHARLRLSLPARADERAYPSPCRRHSRITRNAGCTRRVTSTRPSLRIA